MNMRITLSEHEVLSMATPDRTPPVDRVKNIRVFRVHVPTGVAIICRAGRRVDDAAFLLAPNESPIDGYLARGELDYIRETL
jgi:hypothetical protein